MPARKTTKKLPANGTRNDEVAKYLNGLDHPLRSALQKMRSIILGADPRIEEGIKWNSPSFRLGEYFATANIRNNSVFVILHLGAKVKGNSTAGMTIKDPQGLLKWLSKDRAMLSFPDLKAVSTNQAAIATLVRQWIEYL